jgi:uncharacterized protein (DUF362 family)/NAD-dependent dihydropyrimidine dehydrogenase PreA subunit
VTTADDHPAGEKAGGRAGDATGTEEAGAASGATERGTSDDAATDATARLAQGPPRVPGVPSPVVHLTAEYGPDLQESIERAVAPFGGWSALVSPGERIAVKVNLLRAAAPEKVVTTNPETLRCVLRGITSAGGAPFVADSPGGPSSQRSNARAFRISGMTPVCEQEGVEIVYADDDLVDLPSPQGRLYRSFKVGRAFREADGMVQVGPLKTHALMRLTGGVKLTFGCVAGLTKAQLHVRASERDDFADMLLDLHLAMAPRFTIIDGIVAMEGKGPGGGTPRALGSLFAARDAIALDAALADRTAHDRRRIYTLTAAERRGLIDLSDPYELVGDPVVPDRGFEPATKDLNDRVPAFVRKGSRQLLTSRPRLVAEARCTRCAECADICGVQAIAMRPTPIYDDAKCVRCYACTEVCPTQAIQEVSPLMVRLLGRVGRLTRQR